MLSFRLIPNGLGHFLFIDLIPCLTRIRVFHVAMPRSNHISDLHLISANPLLDFLVEVEFDGGMMLHEPWLETPCSPLRFQQQLSPQYRI